MAHDQLNALPRGYEIEGYRLETVLGSGGFGITYRASEVSLGRTVAVKEYLPAGVAVRGRDAATIHPLSSDDNEMFEWGLDRFRHEAQTLVAFRHPNIVRVLRFFEANGTAYMVMDYEHGESLEAILDRDGTLEESELREFLDPLLDGLAEVHRAGFLHRDIKPGNIYIRNDGQPVLLDFGAARQSLGTKSQSLTAIVTAGYAPHEQYESDGNQGPWTDIYAMGAVLYHAIAGDCPDEAPMRLSAYARDRGDPMTSAHEIGAGRYSIALLDSIDGALRIMEQDRPQTVADWRGWLRGDADIPEPPQTVVTLDDYRPAPPTKRRSGRRLAALAALGLLLVSGVASGGYVAYTEFKTTKISYEAALAKQRAKIDEVRQRATALIRKQTAEEKRRAAEEARRARERIEAAKRRAKLEARRAAENSRRLGAERRRAEIARRRAAIEARKRAAAEATRALEESSRRKALEARRRTLIAERRKATKERRKAALERKRLQEALRKAREGRERAEASLREMRERAKRERAMRERAEAAARRAPERRVAGGPNVVRGNRGQRPANIINPWRRRVAARPPSHVVAAQRLLGRWCGPKGALTFTRSQMIATRYDTGQTGRYRLAGIRPGPRGVVVRFLLPDGMHRVAFGRFSYDNRRMIEQANKRPGRPWRRIGAPWRRC